MKVTFAPLPLTFASARLRGAIPQRELAKLGVEQGTDILVVQKHGWKWEGFERFGKVVFDVCDDHFHTAHRDHYMQACEKADLVTCCTPVLRDSIKRETGRDAFVIPDPYEQPERPPRIGESLLWFGHETNLPGLLAEIDRLADWPLRIVTGRLPVQNEQVWTWSPETMDRAFDEAGLVVIPTGDKPGKSANRAVESIRRGLFVVAGPLPAYSELGIWIGDIRSGVEWALSHQDEALKRIEASQAYVRDEFAPERIGRLWLQAFASI